MVPRGSLILEPGASPKLEGKVDIDVSFIRTIPSNPTHPATMLSEALAVSLCCLKCELHVEVEE